MKRIFLTFLFLITLAGMTGCKKETELTLLQRSCDNAISDIIEDTLPIYKASDTLRYDYNILLSIAALEEEGYDISLNDYLSLSDMQTYYDENYNDYSFTYYSSYYAKDVYDVSTILRCCYYLKLYDLSTESLKEIVEDITFADLSFYDYYSMLTILDLLDINQELKTSVITAIESITTDYLDCDTAAMFLKAIGSSDIDSTVFNSVIDSAISDAGLYYTDFYTNENIYNASSTATGLIGILASRYDSDADLLLNALLSYFDDAAFVDTTLEPDLQFSTPQGFAALVTYKYASIYKGSYSIYD